jgi:hypothetical protein
VRCLHVGKENSEKMARWWPMHFKGAATVWGNGGPIQVWPRTRRGLGGGGGLAQRSAGNGPRLTCAGGQRTLE